MVTAVLQTSLFYLFVRQFPDANWIKANKLLLCFGLFTVLAGLVASSPYMFKAVLILDGQAHMVVGLSVAVFTLYLVFTIFAAFKILLGKYFAAIGMKKTQLFILLVAAVLNWVVIPITNFVLTLVLKTTIFAAISSLYGLLFCSIIGYALTKHYLFDFRRMLSDSVIYIDYHLRDARHRTLQYYELQTLIYRAQTNHVALDFSNVKKLDDQSLVMLRTLNRHMQKQGIRLYFTGLTQKVFLQLKLAKILKLKR